MLVDLNPIGVTGKDASAALDKARITANKNAIPFDERSPFVTSGVRLGTPAMTTRGMQAAESIQVADWIADLLAAPTDGDLLRRVRSDVHALCDSFPLYPELDRGSAV